MCLVSPTEREGKGKGKGKKNIFPWVCFDIGRNGKKKRKDIFPFFVLQMEGKGKMYVFTFMLLYVYISN